MSATVWHGTWHTTTSGKGKRTYRSSPKICKDCPYKTACGANESGQRIRTTHIWQEYLNLVEKLRKIERGKELYDIRKETIERVLADAKGKYAMRYTHHRGLARVSTWVRLKYTDGGFPRRARAGSNHPAPPSPPHRGRYSACCTRMRRSAYTSRRCRRLCRSGWS